MTLLAKCLYAHVDRRMPNVVVDVVAAVVAAALHFFWLRFGPKSTSTLVRVFLLCLLLPSLSRTKTLFDVSKKLALRV